MVFFFSFVMLMWFIIYIDALIGMRSLKKLEKMAIKKPSNHKISIIVAARNEEEAIKSSLLSQFRQTYQEIEWIVINDRSTDQTGLFLEELAKMEPRLQIVTIEKLPPRWLGKNYALYQGFLRAKGEWLLFTDADIHFAEDTVERAISYVNQARVDHLSLAPNIKADTFWLRAFIAFFLFGFSYFKRPWRANRKETKEGIGIGAFNLIHRKVYEAIGTHQQIATRPDDDLQLGMAVKKAGYTQKLLTALSLLEVRWYPSLREAVKGLEKNTFAGLHYRITMVVVAIIGILLTHIFPFLFLWIGTPVIKGLCVLSITFLFLFYRLVMKKMTTYGYIHFLVFPVSSLLFIYTIIRATYKTIRQGGITWRGTFYTFSELQKEQEKQIKR